MPDIRIVSASPYPRILRELFEDYFDHLVENDPDFLQYLILQNYKQELENIPARYARPDAAILLAFVDDQPAGCIAYKRLDESRAELKRLFVKPVFRRQGVARVLLNTLIDQAREDGYRLLLLDTLPFLKEALALYEKAGFTHTRRYNNSPLDSSIYLELKLK